MRAMLSSVFGLLVLSGVTPLCFSQTPLPNESELEQSIAERLSSPRFADRRTATQQLQQLGVAGHPLLERLARHGDVDAATRAMDLLKQAAQSSNATIAGSARQSLERVATAQGTLSGAAEEFLQGRRDPSRTLAPGKIPAQRGLNPQRPVPQFGGAIPQFGGPARRQTQIRIQTINGVRSIEVVVNGHTFKFKDVPGGIKTERPKAGGAPKTKVYQNVDELKQRDPEAFQAYQLAAGPQRRTLDQRFRLRRGRPIKPDRQRHVIPRQPTPVTPRNPVPQPAPPRSPVDPADRIEV